MYTLLRCAGYVNECVTRSTTETVRPGQPKRDLPPTALTTALTAMAVFVFRYTLSAVWCLDDLIYSYYIQWANSVVDDVTVMW